MDAAVTSWIAARPSGEVLAAFEAADAAIAPVLTPGQVVEDPHVVARHSLVEVDGVVMQDVVARLSATPGQVRWAGRRLGADDGDSDLS